MQDRYAGDVGDFVKLGLLRAVSPGRKLGVIWYRYPNENHNKDGRHVSYLEEPDRYAHLDRELFDHLGQVVAKSRTIKSLLPALGDVSSFGESIDLANVAPRERRDWRNEWLSRALDEVTGCDIVFADPDNGIVDNGDWRKGQAKFGKQMPLGEVRAIAQGRCAVIYHHNTRRAGGHDAEVDHWLEQFDTQGIAVRATAYSPRTFFVLNPDPEIEERVRNFCIQWQEMRVRLHTNQRS